MSLHLVLPLPPNRGNDRSHWRKVQREKAAYYKAAWVRILQQTRPTDRGAREDQRIRLTAKLYVWNKYDPDGAVALLKWPIDSLRYAHVLFEDKEPHCTLSGIPKQEIDRKNPRVELWLEPAA